MQSKEQLEVRIKAIYTTIDTARERIKVARQRMDNINYSIFEHGEIMQFFNVQDDICGVSRTLCEVMKVVMEAKWTFTEENQVFARIERLETAERILAAMGNPEPGIEKCISIFEKKIREWNQRRSEKLSYSQIFSNRTRSRCI